MKPEDLPYHHSKIPKNFPERADFLNALEKEFEKDLLTNERYKVFFRDFAPASINQFCKEMAVHKRRLLEYYDQHMRKLNTPKALHYREQAEGIFELILQKKLFNLQLLWRAEKISIPEISISFDFLFYWEDHVHDCPFLDTVAPEEVEVMKQFLVSENYNDQTKSWLTSWQDYDQLIQKNEEEDYELMPEWYEFYDGRMGTGILLQLPNTRGEKEERYRERCAAELLETRLQQPVVQPTEKPERAKPNLFASEEFITEFIEAFEPEYVQEINKGCFTSYDSEISGEKGDTGVEEAIWKLREAEFPIYMPGGYVWHEAIIRCAQQYTNMLIAQDLDSVYEEYLMKRELKIGGRQLNDYEAEYNKSENRKIVLEQILRGRELLNESRNLNF